jgi:hypothetical protein
MLVGHFAIDLGAKPIAPRVSIGMSDRVRSIKEASRTGSAPLAAGVV